MNTVVHTRRLRADLIRESIDAETGEWVLDGEANVAEPEVGSWRAGSASGPVMSDSLHKAAVQKVRADMAGRVGLLAVAEAAAQSIRELTSAMECTVILLDKDEYWDVVDVYAQPLQYPRFPKDSRYPISEYPRATDRLLGGKGYFSGDAADEILMEYRELWPDVGAVSIMGVPIIALGEVHGELFLVRDEGKPPFNRDDLDLVAELATLFGARLPALLANYADSESDVAGQLPMPRLAEKLNDLLN